MCWSPNVTAIHTELSSQSNPAATSCQNAPLCGQILEGLTSRDFGLTVPAACPGGLPACNILHFSSPHSLLHPTLPSLPVLKAIPTVLGCSWPGNSPGITLPAAFLTSKSFFPSKAFHVSRSVRI